MFDCFFCTSLVKVNKRCSGKVAGNMLLRMLGGVLLLSGANSCINPLTAANAKIMQTTSVVDAKLFSSLEGLLGVQS